MKVRAHWVIGEQTLPVSWREFIDAAGGVLGDTLKHIDQIGGRVDVVEPTRSHQTLDEPDSLSPNLGPVKEPRVSSHRNDP